MRIEQAIFTSAQTARQCGYQLVAKSQGVCEADAQALAVWGPSHESLVVRGPHTASLNFHPLPSGASCISYTTPLEGEYSCRGGALVYTQCLVVPPELLDRFSNNPVALFKALLAQGAIAVHAQPPDVLPPLRLLGRCRLLEADVLSACRQQGDAAWLAVLADEVLAGRDLICAADAGVVRTVQGLLNCLPVWLRPEVSFSTGLRYSSCRPFRLICLDELATQQGQLRRTKRSLFDLHRPPTGPRPKGWAALVDVCLRLEDLETLDGELQAHRSPCPPDELARRGAEAAARLEAALRPKPRHLPPVVSQNTLDALCARLREADDLPAVWRAWQTLHSSLLKKQDFDTARLLVGQACRILGRPGELAPGDRDRIGALLDEQIHFNIEAYEGSFAEIERLTLAQGRREWLRLAREVKARRWKPQPQSTIQPDEKIPPQPAARPGDVHFRCCETRSSAPNGPDEPAAANEPTGKPEPRRRGQTAKPKRPDRSHPGSPPPRGVSMISESTAARDSFASDGEPPANPGMASRGGPPFPSTPEELCQALEDDPLLQLADDPSQALGSECPEATAELEELDDVVFEAIAGKEQAFQRLQTLWPEILARLGPDLIEESKSQYLRHAMNVWRQCASDDCQRPEQGMRALDVVCLLLEN